MNRSLILLATITGLLYSCHPSKKIQTPVPPLQIDTVAKIVVPPSHAREDSALFIKQTYTAIQNNRINFTSFSGKIDMDYEDGNGNKYNVNAHLRMYKDSVIWISITAILGIEGLRMYITRDSVKLIDKQNKIYKARSIFYLREMTGLPLALPDLQDLLIGNPVFLDTGISTYNKTGDAVSLYYKGAFFINLLTINAGDRKLQSSMLSDTDTMKTRSCYLTWSDYESKKGLSFPQKRTIHIEDKVKLDIKMDYKQYELNEKLSFPFSVPKNYEQN